MYYSEVRDKIKTGDKIFFSGGSWRTWYGFKVMMVRMYDPSKWSHVATVWAEHDRIFIMESVGAEIRLYPLSKALTEDKLFGWVARPKELPLIAVEWGFSHLGEKYPNEFKMVLKKWLGMNIDMEGRMDCSDFALGFENQAKEYVLECTANPSQICDEVMKHWGSLILVEPDLPDVPITSTLISKILK